MEELAIKKNSPEATLGLLVSVALVDNHYSNEEKIIIYKLCDAYNYPQDKLETLINLAETPNELRQRASRLVQVLNS